MDVSCKLGDSSKKEGIDEAQWAALDKQNRKMNQEEHKIEKWFEIYKVIFPGAEKPQNPCKQPSTSKSDLFASEAALTCSREYRLNTDNFPAIFLLGRAVRALLQRHDRAPNPRGPDPPRRV